MKQLFPRGKRIRPTDKDLVFHTALLLYIPLRRRMETRLIAKILSFEIREPK